MALNTPSSTPAALVLIIRSKFWEVKEFLILFKELILVRKSAFFASSVFILSNDFSSRSLMLYKPSETFIWFKTNALESNFLRILARLSSRYFSVFLSTTFLSINLFFWSSSTDVFRKLTVPFRLYPFFPMIMMVLISLSKSTLMVLTKLLTVLLTVDKVTIIFSKTISLGRAFLTNLNFKFGDVYHSFNEIVLSAGLL